jgi:hypothetical protein
MVAEKLTLSWLNIVNEYDLIASTDKRYINSLIELYSSGDPLPIQNSDQNDVHTDVDSRPCWPFPAPHVQHIGPVIVLKIGPPATDMGDGVAPSPRLVLSAWRITAEEFSSLIFCRLSVHSRTTYQERIQKIESGCLNE